MKPPVIISIRFSYWDPELKGAWNLSRSADDLDYKNKLFDTARLDAKFRIFENIVIPSLAGQTDTDNFSVFAITSEDLPPEYKSRLQQLEKAHSWFHPVFAPPGKFSLHSELIHQTCLQTGASLYAHSRLDDDDALAKDFVKNVRRYTRPEFAQMGLTFSRGYTGIYDESRGRYSGIYDRHVAKMSCGLTCIGTFDPVRDTDPARMLSAYSLGNHVLVDQKRPVIMDGRSPGFIYAQYPSQDSDNTRAIPKTPPVPASEVQKFFTIARQVLPEGD